MNMEQFTKKSLEALQNAQSLAVERGNQQIEQPHLLLALVADGEGFIPQLLTAMGMTDAFDWKKADFSRMGCTADGTNLCIGRVIHKTKITVAEEGTKAAASTVVEMLAEGAAEIQEETRTVTLNRPFLYMIVDTEHMEPIFMGTLLDPQV